MYSFTEGVEGAGEQVQVDRLEILLSDKHQTTQLRSLAGENSAVSLCSETRLVGGWTEMKEQISTVTKMNSY